MAKAKKTTRKSASSSSKKTSKKKTPSKTNKTTKKTAKKTEKKVPVLICQYCEKSMKDEKTKRVHERSCKKKQEEKVEKIEKKEKDLEGAVLKLKDEFEDQRSQLADQFTEREDKLHDEIRELKEVLRMEIEHRHKEQERIKKEKAAETPPVEVSTIEMPDDVKQIAETVVESPPKAIDLIPTPMPDIPKRVTVDTPEQPIVEVLEVGQIEEYSEIEDVKEEAVGVNEEMISGIINEKIEELMIKEKTEISKDEVNVLKSEIENISKELNEIKRNMEVKSSELTSKMEGYHLETEFKRIDRELGKFSEKIAEIIDEVGFGEHLNVAKIPPTILEIVYQATMDDLTTELSKAIGSQDAEKVSRQALEEVRLKTSGSELFKFDGRKIVTDNLAYSIEADLISAKQIQTTYDELLHRLLENLPHHKAKNFRAMIKVKSQEFAVDRATMLTKEVERIGNLLESSGQMLAALSAQVNALNLEIREEFNEIKDNLLTNKVDISEIDMLKTKFKDWEEREASFMRDLGVLKADIEMAKKIATKTPKEEKIEKPKKIKKEEISEEKKKIPANAEEDILKALDAGTSSKTALIRETGLEEKELLDLITKLIGEKKVVEKKVGKRVKYSTPDQILEKKISDKIEPKKKKEPVKVETSPMPKKEVPVKIEKAEEDKKEEKKPAKPKDKKKKEIPKKVKEPTLKEIEEKKGKPEKKKDTKVPEPKEAVKEKAPKKPKEEAEKLEKKADAIPKEAEKEEIKAGVSVPDEKKKAEVKKEPEVEPPEMEIVPPSSRKSLEELTEEEKRVLEVITEDGRSRSGIQSKVGKDVTYTAVLRALRILIDSGYVGILTKGRLTLYQKIKVEEMGKPKKEKNKMEVK